MAHSRNTSYRHKEAFALMRYRCEICEAAEVFWNSRDGVTPFVTTGACQRCGGSMVHTDWSKDQCDPAHVPHAGQGVFCDTPESFKRPVAAARVAGADGTPHELQGEDRAEMIEAIIRGFQPGEPWFLRW